MDRNKFNAVLQMQSNLCDLSVSKLFNGKVVMQQLVITE